MVSRRDSISTYVVGGKTVITRFIVFRGADRVDLTDASFSSSDPGWSANGNQVVFTTHLPGSPDAGMQNIWIMKSNGAGKFQYTYYER